MPSFDVISEVDKHELTNAVDQAKREMGNRWDFKKVDSSIELSEFVVTLSAEQDFQLDQLKDILIMAMVNRKIDTRTLEDKEDSKLGKQVKRALTVKQGIDSVTAKKMVKLIKDAKLKVQAAIMGEKLRITGKKRDDLQQTMALLRGSDDIDIPLQFENFRD
jgi:uncharacterized protein YajQ (UPF0234 family)